MNMAILRFFDLFPSKFEEDAEVERPVGPPNDVKPPKQDGVGDENLQIRGHRPCGLETDRVHSQSLLEWRCRIRFVSVC